MRIFYGLIWIPLSTLRLATAKLYAREVDSEQYNRWRYNYPKYDTTQHWGKVPSQELSDAIVEKFGDKLVD